MRYAYALQTLACYISIIHWVACLWVGHVVDLPDNEDEMTAYGESLYAAVTLLLNISSIPVKRESAFLCAVLAILGFLFSCLTLASVTAVIIGSSSRAVQYQDKVRAVMNDLKALQIPVELRKATKAYYETLWRMKNTSDRYEKAIYEDEDLSPALRSEIALYIHRSLIATVPLFQGCSDSCLACVVMKLKTQLYMRGDVVFHKGDPANSMVIISRGKVRVLSPDNEAILAVLKQGCFFGEIGLLRNMTRSCTVVSATFCELKSLQRRDAEEVFELYPQIHDRLFAESEKRRRDTRLKANFYNVKVLDNAHAVDVSNVEDQGEGNDHSQPFIHGAAAADLDGSSGDSHQNGGGSGRAGKLVRGNSFQSEGSSRGGNGKAKLVRGNSFQSEESTVIHAELDSMNVTLEEIERLLGAMKSAQANLAKVHDRRLSLHQALSALRPLSLAGNGSGSGSPAYTAVFTPVGIASRSTTPLPDHAPLTLPGVTRRGSKMDGYEMK